MITERQFMRGAVALLAAAVAAVGYNQSRVRADGIPAMRPLTYSGTLSEGGAPVTGTRNLRLTIWDDPMSTESSHNRCISVATGAAVNAGRFAVTLDDACTTVVRSTPDLWLEIEVNGTSLGRTKLGAVPFAVEAQRAADLSQAARNSLVPPGTVIAFAGNTAPAGWLLCDGRAVAREGVYQTLFRTIDTAHGAGDGTSTFNLPDYRGRFLRGVDGTAGRDPDRAGRTAANAGGNVGNAIGSVQEGALGSHSHGVTQTPHSHGTSNGSAFYGWAPSRAEVGWSNLGLGRGVEAGPAQVVAAQANVAIQAAGGTETRPVNAYVNYLIKF